MANRILVVDDDDRIRLLYQKELSQSGYRVETAASGREAIEKTGAGSFDLAVLDIEMPDLSGLEVLSRMREQAPHMAVILNSAYSTYKSDFQSWLADAYIVKSSDMDPLKAKIKELLERS
jgi:DNA-binding response OmpR family regulator